MDKKTRDSLQIKRHTQTENKYMGKNIHENKNKKQNKNKNKKS